MEVDVNFVRNDITSERFCTIEETETSGEKSSMDRRGSDGGEEEETRRRIESVEVEERRWRAKACYDTTPQTSTRDHILKKAAQYGLQMEVPNNLLFYHHILNHSLVSLVSSVIGSCSTQVRRPGNDRTLSIPSSSHPPVRPCTTSTRSPTSSSRLILSASKSLRRASLHL
eukprot:767997-Hanusia_phi.AAC.2